MGTVSRPLYFFAPLSLARFSPRPGGAFRGRARLRPLGSGRRRPLPHLALPVHGAATWAEKRRGRLIGACALPRPACPSPPPRSRGWPALPSVPWRDPVCPPRSTHAFFVSSLCFTISFVSQTPRGRQYSTLDADGSKGAKRRVERRIEHACVIRLILALHQLSSFCRPQKPLAP